MLSGVAIDTRAAAFSSGAGYSTRVLAWLSVGASCASTGVLAISTSKSSTARACVRVDSILAAPVAAVLAWTIVDVVLAVCSLPSSTALACVGVGAVFAAPVAAVFA